MPKAKTPPQNQHTYRLELQDKEREALDMISASIAVKNVGQGLGSVIGAFTRATLPGVALWGGVLAALLIEVESISPGAMFPRTIGQLGANAEAQPFSPRQPGETNAEWRRRTTAWDRLYYNGWTRAKETISEDFGRLWDHVRA